MRIAMGIEYDGAKYFGWQRLREGPSVQAVVEKAISTVAAAPTTVICAGRTDSSVHAQGQVIHFDTEAERKPYSWLMGCNVNLPGDVSVTWAQPVSDDFHARFGAYSRSYRYVILNRPGRSAILDGKVTHYRYPLNAELMHEAAQSFLGRQDFSSVRAQGCQAHSPCRTISEISVTQEGDFIYLDIRANAFLYHMVRNITGVLFAVGREDKPVSWVKSLLALKDRSKGAITAPPDGLYLVDVFYPDEHNVPQVTRPIRF